MELWSVGVVEYCLFIKSLAQVKSYFEKGVVGLNLCVKVIPEGSEIK
jgi:hypothetical protein